ncbi:MAG: acetyl-CoA carboxylase biotin carboxylase subunit [Rickettsiales bacterium TMED254]|nr:acetyl/propionyl-CoA carboxylase subunit alpha [Rickettsiales bacterium]RPF75879.1 MAG: acetyl-CoA carboxylase biotin carboxylase subunit [Rickettsiales bacterium TMED254]
MIKKVLIANRGEIAIRIAKSCKKLGIKTVGVFSKDDEFSLHLDYCDEKYLLGEDPLKGSYLNIDKIMKVAIESNTDAVHPGYGFLSENSLFVKALEGKKIIFIGPSNKSIELMGDKIESKKIAKQAGVNCIPGYEEAIKDINTGIKYAKDIGFPVMIKASAGGGGKGMRIANNLDDFEELVIAAKNEARNAFGDDRVFIEKYIEKPRHIEMQILGDRHGNIIWLGERECSIQRRHQKIIEEAPSSFLDNETREQMGEQAVKLAKEVGYFSAGTVEFVVNDKKEFFFLEMNTRLQVEHPVTEAVTGIDLVEQMINIANNKALKIDQQSIKTSGWAFESRICAENPKKNFLPSAGRIKEFIYPDKNTRVDLGYRSGDEVSIFYDSLIAKVISKGSNRDNAIKNMQKTLQELSIKGIETNLDFLMDIYKNPLFAKGDINTNFIAENYNEGYTGKVKNKKEIEIMSLMALCQKIDYLNSFNNNNLPKDWTLNCSSSEIRFKLLSIQGQEVIFLLDKVEEKITYEINYINSFIHINFRNYKFTGRFSITESFTEIFYNGGNISFTVLTTKSNYLYKKLPKDSKKSNFKELLSPMPGKVTKIFVKENDIVEAGDNLIILDAMKMENILKADFPGQVKKLYVKEDDSVSADQLLIKLN